VPEALVSESHVQGQERGGGIVDGGDARSAADRSLRIVASMNVSRRSVPAPRAGIASIRREFESLLVG
jgi:hypothetical protein